MTSVKQVIIMRKDLNMRKGKMVAQGAHASMAAILQLGQIYRGHSDIDGSLIDINMVLTLFRAPFGKFEGIDHSAAVEWLENAFTKVCVSVNSESELIDVIDKAKAAGMITSLITDSGLTEFGGVPTITCGAIGPAYVDQVDSITGGLKLL
jgi:PTH2 family peptidyl-tRNA hydrolase